MAVSVRETVENILVVGRKIRLEDSVVSSSRC